ncbi:hypothetical protein RFI_27579 [Reticulomyxa filosa]|uniref:NACHT domain-containing protein n=1 Tax=Reticulomyxa filosa TaxID=46433 RepID=X6M722_RETFI|nr:hypothetical protein RFI_27579 [Reticulomyxa filosa]|eukprot:ETO09798.1 hypothetical protein RFI_27579 [Reticulomyxa filosa]
MKCNGGMQNNDIGGEETRKYAKEMKTLLRLFGDITNKEELHQKIQHHNGNIELIIKDLIQQSVEKQVTEIIGQLFCDEIETENKENEPDKTEQVNKLFHKQQQRNEENKIKNVQKETEKTEIGEIEPGINLQGCCINETCLASKAKLLVWANIGFGTISLISDKNSFYCPDCEKLTVTSIAKVMFYNSEYSICASDNLISVKDNNYQSIYPIQSGVSYELKANKIRQHAKSIEDLRERNENAMNSVEINNLVTELQKYEIKVVKPSSLKGNDRLLEKIQSDYGGDFNQAFDIGRFTILCDNPTKLQTAVAVMKKAEQFNLIVSEDKDFFNRQSKTHHRFHNIKLYVPKHDVYIEMQATLKHFTTLEGHTAIENPKLSHNFYEIVRAWKSNNLEEEELKQASNQTLAKMNDVICEWIDTKEIKKISNRYKPHSEMRILKPPQLKGINEEQINSKKDTSLKLTKFVYYQLCKFNPKEMKGQAIYVILFEYFKKHIMGEMNPASCADVVSILKESRRQELEEDTATLQALETYIPLQANNYPYTDNDDNKQNDAYDCYQHVIDLLSKEKEEKKGEPQNKKHVMILQGKSGSGKSLFCRHLEETLWETYSNGLITSVPIYISLSKCYNEFNEKQIISQALQMKRINKEIIDVIRENISFVFILDGFDEIFDKYDKNADNERYFYNRFNLNEWNAEYIVSCRSHSLSDEDIKHVLINSNNTTSMIYLWPFSKAQMNGYIDKFVKINRKNKMHENLDWTIQQYADTLKSYPNLNKMMEEPFLLRMILTVLPSLIKQHPIGTKISKSQVYEAFNDQWIDVHVNSVSNKLSELRIQTNSDKIKFAFQQYCQDLGFEMFMQGNQVATENDDQMEYINKATFKKLDPNVEIEIKHMDEKVDMKIMNEDDITSVKTQDVWGKYFNGDSIAKYVLRRICDNKYQFLHKSCQEYYTAQKIIFDILLWKPNTIDVDMNNERFQQQFETRVPKLFINCKLLNEELGIIQFIAERIHDINPIFINLKSRLFRIIESSKTNEHISVAAANAVTILNSANVNMHYRNWENIKIPHAILDQAFLEGTNFKHANLDHVSLYQSFLNKANFTNASMNNIYFGEYAHLEGHSEEVNGIQLSPDGTKIISYSNDKTVRIWDVLSGKQLQLLKGHSDIVNSAQFSPDGLTIVSCSRDETVRLWDVLSGKQIQILEDDADDVNAAQFSPDGSKVVSCSEDNAIRIWDISSGERTQLLQGHSDWVNAVQFSPDGTKVVSCSDDETIRIWDVLSGEQLQVLEGHSERVTKVQFLSNGSKVISCSNDKTIRIWDSSSAQQIQIFEGHSGAINGIQFSSDNSIILSYSQDKTIRLWNALSGEQIQMLEGHANSVETAKFSFDSSQIVSGSEDKTIRIWDVSSGKQLQIIDGHLRRVTGVEFFPKDPKIVSCSWDGTIRIWDIALQRKIQLTEGHFDSVTEVQFSPDGSKIVSCSLDKTLRLWDVQSGKQIHVFEGHSSGARGIKFSSDGSKILTNAYLDNIVQIWEVSSGKLLQILEGHTDFINSVQFSPDDQKILLLRGHSDSVKKAHFSSNGSRIVSCSFDRTVRLWDAISGNQLQLFRGHLKDINNVLFSPNGSTIVSCSGDKTIRLWDVSSGKQIFLLEKHSESIDGIQFSPDSTKIVSHSLDNTIRLWDTLSGKQLQVLEGHSNYIEKALFSSDGFKIISFSQDKTIRIWDVSSGNQIQILEGHIGGITDAQFSPDNSKIWWFINERKYVAGHKRFNITTEIACGTTWWKILIFLFVCKKLIEKNSTSLDKFLLKKNVFHFYYCHTISFQNEQINNCSTTNN